MFINKGTRVSSSSLGKSYNLYLHQIMDLNSNVQEKPPFCKGIGRTKFPAIYTASAIPLDGSSSLQFNCPSRRQVQLGKNKQEKDNYLPSFSEP